MTKGFDTTHVGRINFRFERQFLLCQLSLLTVLSDVSVANTPAHAV